MYKIYKNLLTPKGMFLVSLNLKKRLNIYVWSIEINFFFLIYKLLYYY